MTSPSRSRAGLRSWWSRTVGQPLDSMYERLDHSALSEVPPVGTMPSAAAPTAPPRERQRLGRAA